MKQITPEIKAKIFALYWSQNIRFWTMNGPQPLCKIGATYMSKHIVKNCSLLVKPLSSITDEHAIECLNLMLMKGYSFKTLMEYSDHNKYGNEQKVNYFKRNIPYYMDSSRLVDYLRSKGYALPAFGYSVDELVEAGVFKIKEVNND